MVANVLLGDLLLIQVGIDLIRPDIIFSQRVLAKGAHTQREMKGAAGYGATNFAYGSTPLPIWHQGL